MDAVKDTSRPSQLDNHVIYGSPAALGSAGVLMKKICYGLVLPGLLVTEILYIHVS